MVLEMLKKMKIISLILFLIFSSIFYTFGGSCHSTFIDIHEANICPGGTANVNIINPIGNQLWFNGATSNYYNFYPDSTFTGFLINDAGTNCADTIYFTITVYPKVKPDVTFAPNDTVCQGTEITLTILNPINNILWQGGDTTTIVKLTADSDFTIYTINDHEGRCPDTSFFLIKVYQPFDLGNDIDITCEQKQNINLNLNYAPKSILWSNGLTSQSVTLTQAGTYYVSVDNGTCIYSDTIKLFSDDISATGPFVPNGFTPNQDGLNEVFNVRGVLPNNFQLTIFNRWGVEVFQSNNPAIGWDGNYRSNKSPEGTYFWILNYQSTCSLKINSIHGYVALIR